MVIVLQSNLASFTSRWLDHQLGEIGLFTFNNYCVPCSIDYLKSELESNSRLPFPKFSGSHCSMF